MKSKKLALLLCTLACSLPAFGAGDASKPVNVFILAGQSNMECDAT
jgi:hypothetical protein